jgi:hypothetical protein
MSVIHQPFQRLEWVRRLTFSPASHYFDHRCVGVSAVSFVPSASADQRLINASCTWRRGLNKLVFTGGNAGEVFDRRFYVPRIPSI